MFHHLTEFLDKRCFTLENNNVMMRMIVMAAMRRYHAVLHPGLIKSLRDGLLLLPFYYKKIDLKMIAFCLVNKEGKAPWVSGKKFAGFNWEWCKHEGQLFRKMRTMKYLLSE
jgi:hypothetical protein